MGVFLGGIGTKSTHIVALLFWNNLRNSVKNSRYPKISPPLRRSSTFVGVNRSVINFQRWNRPSGASGDSSLFSFVSVSAENFEKKLKILCFSLSFVTVKAWKGLDWFFFIRWMNLVTPIENIAGHEYIPNVFGQFFGSRDLKNWFLFSFFFRFRVSWLVFNWLESRMLFVSEKRSEKLCEVWRLFWGGL